MNRLLLSHGLVATLAAMALLAPLPPTASGQEPVMFPCYIDHSHKEERKDEKACSGFIDNRFAIIAVRLCTRTERDGGHRKSRG